MKKRILSIVLCASLTLGLFSGCGGGSTSETTGNLETSSAKNTQETSSGNANTGKETVTSDDKTSQQAVSGEILEISLPRVSRERELVLTAGNLALQSYVNARMWTEKLERIAQSDVSDEELTDVLEHCIEAWKAADTVCSKAEYMGSLLGQAEVLPEFQWLQSDRQSKLIPWDVPTNFSIRLFGKGMSDIRPPFSDDFLQESIFGIRSYAAEYQYPIDINIWAETMNKLYNSAPAGERVQHLANILGTDTKDAWEQMQAVEEILHNKAKEDEKLPDICYKVAKTLCTAGKVAGFGLAATAFAGAPFAATVGSMVKTLGGATLLTFQGVDVVTDVYDTGATILVGTDDNLSVEVNEIKDGVSVASAFTGAHGLYAGNWRGFENWGQQLLFMGESIKDYNNEGKIMGVVLKENKNGNMSPTLVSTEIPVPYDSKASEDVMKTLIAAGMDETYAKALADSGADNVAGGTASLDGSLMKPWNELDLEDINGYLDYLDVLKQMQDNEKVIEELAKELEKSIEESYHIIMNSPEKFAGRYTYLSDENGEGWDIFEKLPGKTNKDRSVPPVDVVYENEQLDLILEGKSITDSLNTKGVFDPDAGTLTYMVEGESLICYFKKDESGNQYMRLCIGGDTTNSGKSLEINQYYIRTGEAGEE